jgi:hypothetical protein
VEYSGRSRSQGLSGFVPRRPHQKLTAIWNKRAVSTGRLRRRRKRFPSSDPVRQGGLHLLASKMQFYLHWIVGCFPSRAVCFAVEIKWCREYFAVDIFPTLKCEYKIPVGSTYNVFLTREITASAF